MKHELTMNEIAKFQKEYEQKPQNRVAELAVVNNGVAKASLDSEKAREVVDILAKESKDKNKATIMVTHDTRLIDKCDRIFMMEDGVLKEKE